MNPVPVTITKKAMKILPSIIMAATCFATTSTQASLLSNGSFESPNIGLVASLTIFAGSQPAGFFWTVTTNSVDIISNGVLGTTGTVLDGVQALDLVGFGSTGGISQLFPTTAGTQYMLSFAYANNPLSTSTASATVTLMDSANLLLSQSITHNTSIKSNFDWTLFSASFTGTGDPVTLAFNNTVGGNNGGIFLDAVSVSAVPIPAAFWLFGSGLATLFLRSRHRRVA